MILYLSLFGGLYLLGKLGSVGKKNTPFKLFYFIVALIVLSFIAGLRGEQVGNDTTSYIKMIKDWQVYDNFFKLEGRTEIGFVMLVRFFSLIHSSPNFVLFCISVVTIFIYLYVIFRNSANIPLSIVLFFILGVFFESMNIVRQTLACAVIVVAYQHIQLKNIIRFCLLTAVAMSIHYTAIFGLVFFVFINIKPTRMKLNLLVILFLFVALFLDPILEVFATLFPKYSVYFNGSYFNGSGYMAIIKSLTIYILILLFVISFSRSCQIDSKELFLEKNKIPNIYRNNPTKLCISALIVIILFLFVGLQANILDRIIKYYSIILVIALPNFAALIENKNKRFMFTMLIVLLFGANISVSLIFRPEWNVVIPYIPFWG